MTFTKYVSTLHSVQSETTIYSGSLPAFPITLASNFLFLVSRFFLPSFRPRFFSSPSSCRGQPADRPSRSTRSAMAGPWRAILRVAAVLCALHVATAQFEAPEFNIAVRKADIPFIKCDVCRKMAEQLDQQVERAREKAEPKKCKTIQRACQDIMGEHDTDIAERIFNDEPSQSSLQRHLCHDLSKACSSKPPPVPQDREPGENWQKKDTSPPDYSKMAKEMNIPTSVMHDEVGRSTTPRITAPVHTCTHAHRKEKDTSPPDYSKMAKEMNIPTSVMHDEVRGGVMQHIGVFKRQQEKQAAGEAKAAAGGGKKKKKGSKKGGASSKEEQMGEVYAQAEEAAKGGKEEIVKFVEKMTGKKVPQDEPETETAGYDEL
ncbi:unnamed protein product [Closterium sp. NIES-53]